MGSSVSWTCFSKWREFRPLPPLLSFWSHFIVCIDVYFDRRSGDSGVKHLVEAMRWNCGDGGVNSCWWTVAGWYFLVVPASKSVGDRESESGVWVAMAEMWRQGSPHESTMNYLPWLISCRLLQVNLRARGKHLPCQLSWVTVWLLVTQVCPV